MVLQQEGNGDLRCFDDSPVLFLTLLLLNFNIWLQKMIMDQIGR